jgi:1-acyl-sn-glycerol-3-phosphate acyltransferase
MFESLNYQNYEEEKEHIEKAFKKLEERYKYYKDPWGFDLELCKKAMTYLWPMYRKYFKVRVFGTENIENHPYVVTSNHSGQIPIDGMLITMAMMMEVDPPRVCRGMVERFLAGLPFLGELTAKTGSILGDRSNATFLLENGESILVFPEGVRGVSKNTTDYYKLQDFTKGFFRIALQAKRDILPVAVVGAEEFFPFVYHNKKLAKMLGAPAFPLSLNYVPLPSPVDIYFGKPYKIPEGLSPDAPDSEINEHVYKIQNRIKRLMAIGIRDRRQFFDPIRKPLNKFFKERNKNK